MMFRLHGEKGSPNIAGDTPVLWVLRDHFQLTGTKSMKRLILSVLFAVGLLGGCGSEQTPQESAAVAPEMQSQDLETMLANADVERGETMYLQCRACHSMLEGAPHKVGPNINGVFERPAGTAPGFAYSDVLKDSGIVWDPDTMDQWLARPSKFLPGNRMVFVGIKNPQDRANLIAFLQESTSGTQ
jgi:cytochrome c